MKHLRLFGLAALVALSAVFAWAQTPPVPSPAPPAAVVQPQVPSSREQVQLTFAPIAKTAAPAVVNVYTRKYVRAPTSPLLQDPFFRRFFGDTFGLGAPQERIQRSLGSGVIVDPKGFVITNHHVVKGSDEITVVLNDRREFAATVLGSDERTDLAVLRIDTGDEQLPWLAMGDSDELAVGDLVLAIGNPFGVGQTVTSGIVSALARSNVGVGDFQSFIQTDAAINPGNSGGALIDMQGRLVGVNTAIYSRDGGSNGIGFAIPTTMVRTVLTAITQGGQLVRPWLGVSVQPLTADMAAALRLPRPAGVLVNGLYPGGPAAKAGLRIGDVVMAVNGRAIDDDAALRFRLATMPVGGQAELAVVREGKDQRVTVGLIAPPDQPSRDETEIRGHNPLAGAIVANLNPALAEELGLEIVEPAVIVTAIRRGSIAQRLNFRPGDLLLRLNDRPIAKVEELRRVVERGGDVWRVGLNREGEILNFVVER
jgi:Do/DeqQ family serine protease